MKGGYSGFRFFMEHVMASLKWHPLRGGTVGSEGGLRVRRDMS